MKIMKSFVFILLGLVSHSVINAQFRSDFDSAIHVFKNKINHAADKINFQRLIYADQKSIPDDCIVWLQQPLLSFQNNVNNRDIFLATPDNMYMIRPDSTLSFNMPVIDPSKREN